MTVLFLICCVFSGVVNAENVQRHLASGIVLKVDAHHHLLLISCNAIPGYMGAMEMPFLVKNLTLLKEIKAGMQVKFLIVKHGKKLYAEKIQKNMATNFDPEPMEAGNIAILHQAFHPSSAIKPVALGEKIPDFTLTDQAGKQINLFNQKGKVVALTFGYSRCPYPNYCFRLSNNLAQVEKRFHSKANHDFVLMTVVIDPDHDQGLALTEYADTWKANPEIWHFLTGTTSEIRSVAGMFGMNFWSAEGVMTHSLHTVVIDRNGRLVANLEGNQFTAKQIGDLMQTVMDRQQ